MRKFKLGILLLCMVLMLCACMMPEENQVLKGKTQAMLDAILADDAAAVRGMISTDISNTEFETFYAQAREVFGGIAEYELKQLNWHKNITNGVTIQQAQFLMTAGEDTYVLQIVLSSEMEGIAGFQFDRYVETVTTGTLLTMQGANGAQWVFLLIGLAEIGLIIWAVVDCARSKIKKKALWIVLILFGSVIWTLSAVQGKLNFNFNIGMFLTHTALLRYSTGGFMLRLYLPIGMVVYWFLRKKLRAEAAAAEAVVIVQEYPQSIVYAQPILENNMEETTSETTEQETTEEAQ